MEQIGAWLEKYGSEDLPIQQVTRYKAMENILKDTLGRVPTPEEVENKLTSYEEHEASNNIKSNYIPNSNFNFNPNNANSNSQPINSFKLDPRTNNTIGSSNLEISQSNQNYLFSKKDSFLDEERNLFDEKVGATTL